MRISLATMVSAILISSLTGPVRAAEPDESTKPPAPIERLEAFVSVTTTVYFALGACDGFIAPEEEAAFDPYGPMLAQWPDSFKRQMSETREEGRIEAAAIAKRHRFSLEERAKLCSSQLDDAVAGLEKIRSTLKR